MPRLLRPRLFECRRTTTALALPLLLGAILGGCDDPPDNRERTNAAPLAGSMALVDRSWVGMTDAVAPDHWLASRQAGVDVAPTDPGVSTFHRLLARAGHRYTETPRMIANRVVQIEGMLAEHHIRETLLDILTGLTEIAPEDGRRSFGETGEHYVALRGEGLARDQALTVLAGQWGQGGVPTGSRETER